MFKDRKTERKTLRQSDIVDYRAAYFAAKKRNGTSPHRLWLLALACWLAP